MEQSTDLTLINNEQEIPVDREPIVMGGTSDYSALTNKPQINSVELTGNKSSHDLGLQGELTAGENITIDNGEISATDTTYSAGDNIAIDENNEISATYTAGDNVSINNGEISATDTTYTAGANVSISANNEISATDTKYTAGQNISISNSNEISAVDTTYSAGSNVSIDSNNEISVDLSNVQPKTSKVTISNNSTTALADNTEYSGTDLSTVIFSYPQGDFECYLTLSFASSGTITVVLPNSQYIGTTPTFANGTWELSIKNGVVVAGKVESNE